ncbi:PLP-dependent aminotransferase family protein [Alteromonas sp. 5E99-2]|uniref:aminotransferase-like domain-containing protein n=1 Tax=Alteromonas sp. 5E99-2 TaxID=2817683 RepID=UPI001A989E48|nr:PLP-dependent aminotransferase family protein [Alteromonas sp. 5E99-2]MBO1257018.1 PLP-dependent aminotransferase family protein [Alteromonas sp. 5E99-2]
MRVSHSLKNIRPSYIREILTEAKKPGVISLAGGLPATEFLPVDLFESALKSIADEPELYQYGETLGHRPLIDYLQENSSVANHKTMICSGSQQGLDLIARAFLNKDDTIVLEAPSYLGALQVFELTQANIEAVTQQADGPDLNALEQLFTTKDVQFFYGVPDFHNPTGVSWSTQKREGVAALCKKHNVFFIEDAPYRELQFGDNMAPLVSSFCPEKSVLLQSFSKSVTPGIRLASVSASEWVIDELIKLKQAADLHSALPLQAALLHVLQHADYPSHLKNVCAKYESRYQFIAKKLEALKQYGCTFNTVEGGMFIWLALTDLDDNLVAKKLLEQGVCVVPGSVFYPQGCESKPALRLNFSYCNPEQLSTAIGVIEKTLKEFC